MGAQCVGTKFKAAENAACAETLNEICDQHHLQQAHCCNLSICRFEQRGAIIYMQSPIDQAPFPGIEGDCCGDYM